MSPDKMLQDNEKFIQDFLVKLQNEGTSDNEMDIRALVHDCMYLLSRLGYTPNTINVRNKQFLTDALNELGLNNRNAWREDEQLSTTDETVEQRDASINESIKVSKNLESFMETVNAVKNTQDTTGNNNRDADNLIKPVLHKSWLSQSKVSFNDSDSDNHNEMENAEILIDKPLFRKTQLQFVRNVNSKIDKLSRLCLNDKNLQRNIQLVEDTLVEDIHSFFSHVKSLENAEAVETKTATSSNLQVNSEVSEAESGNSLPDDEPLISGSFVKIKKSHTEQFKPYKSMFS